MTEKIINGILAYGSVISDPREQIEQAMINYNGHVIGAFTPFPVEFARKSTKRAFAPTLVPFEDGKKVKGQVFAMDLPENFGAKILYERETGIRKENHSIVYYNANDELQEIYTIGKTEIVGLKDFAGLGKVLFAYLVSTIHPLNSNHLACLAIQSIASPKYDPGRDGISYLIDAKQSGIITLHSSDYENDILQITKACCLKQALEKTRRQSENIQEIRNELDALLALDKVDRHGKVLENPDPQNVVTARSKLEQIFSKS